MLTIKIIEDKITKMWDQLVVSTFSMAINLVLLITLLFTLLFLSFQDDILFKPQIMSNHFLKKLSEYFAHENVRAFIMLVPNSFALNISSVFVIVFEIDMVQN